MNIMNIYTVSCTKFFPFSPNFVPFNCTTALLLSSARLSLTARLMTYILSSYRYLVLCVMKLNAMLL